MFLKKILRKFVGLFCHVRDDGHNNIIQNYSNFGHNFRIHFMGNGNVVKIGKDCLLSNTSIRISGNNNTIIIKDNARFIGPCEIIMGSDSTLEIGVNAGIRGVEFNLDGANITVGGLCMFSYGITLRNHDSHKIFDLSTNKRINIPQNIVLGKHVWIAQDATILKGAVIGDDSVIGFGSLVTSAISKQPTTNCIIAGIPAQVVKQGIKWDY